MISPYNGQYREIADIFYGAVHHIAIANYTVEQVNAWAPYPIDYDVWRSRCEHQQPWLWIDQGQVQGFIEFEADGHINCHYVAPPFHRQDIGSRLLKHCLNLGKSKGLPRIYVEASHGAKGLYQRHGFRVIKKNEAVCHGVILENWCMELNFSFLHLP